MAVDSLSDASAKRNEIGLVAISVNFLSKGSIPAMHVSMIFIPIGIFTAFVFTTLIVALVRRSPTLMKRLICPVVMTGSSVAEQTFKSCEFPVLFIQPAERKLLVTKFGSVLVLNKHLVLQNIFSIATFDAHMQ